MYLERRGSQFQGLSGLWADEIWPGITEAGKNLLNFEMSKQVTKQQEASAKIAEEARKIETEKNRVPITVLLLGAGIAAFFGYKIWDKRKKRKENG